jgi:hypothetical protein
LKSAKGYRRSRFEEAWATYCPVKTLSRAQGGFSKRRSVEAPAGSAQVGDFRSVEEASFDGSKNGKLSYSHAGLDASTDKKGGNGARNDFATSEAPSIAFDDGLDIPPSLVRTGHRCDHCGSQLGSMSRWEWPGRPEGVWLHPRCEEAWHDNGGLTADKPTSKP